RSTLRDVRGACVWVRIAHSFAPLGWVGSRSCLPIRSAAGSPALHPRIQVYNSRVISLQRAAFIALFAAASSIALAAQWPSFPSQNIPRTADGKPDLRAKAPRTADGKPDFSGIWENPGWRNLGTGVSGTGGAPGTPAVLPRGPGLFFDIASGVPGGLPLTPYGAGVKKMRMANNSADNPDAHCLPLGNVQLHTHPMPRKIVQTPKVMLLLYEGNAGIRQILIDGRPLPPRDAQPWWYGYTTASWDGDVLVAKTSGF